MVPATNIRDIDASSTVGPLPQEERRSRSAMLTLVLIHILCLAAFVGLASQAPVIEDMD